MNILSIFLLIIFTGLMEASNSSQIIFDPQSGEIINADSTSKKFDPQSGEIIEVLTKTISDELENDIANLKSGKKYTIKYFQTNLVNSKTISKKIKIYNIDNEYIYYITSTRSISKIDKNLIISATEITSNSNYTSNKLNNNQSLKKINSKTTIELDIGNKSIILKSGDNFSINKSNQKYRFIDIESDFILTYNKKINLDSIQYITMYKNQGSAYFKNTFTFGTIFSFVWIAGEFGSPIVAFIRAPASGFGLALYGGLIGLFINKPTEYIITEKKCSEINCKFIVTLSPSKPIFNFSL